MFKFQYQNGKKRRSGKKFLGYENGAIMGLQIGARGITNRDSLRDFKLWQKDYKSGQKDFKFGPRLQIGAEITNLCRTIKAC